MHLAREGGRPAHLAVLMFVENGKAEIIERRTVDQREHLTIRTVAKEIFTITKPSVSEELLEKMKVQVREIVQDEGAE